jgi:hypothetical protein
MMKFMYFEKIDCLDYTVYKIANLFLIELFVIGF